MDITDFENIVELRACSLKVLSLEGSVGARFAEDGREYNHRNIPVNGNTKRRHYSSHEFIELLDTLEIPSLITDNHLRVWDPSTVIGAGGHAEVKRETLSIGIQSPTIVAIKEYKDTSPVSADLERESQVLTLSPEAVTQAFLEVCIMKHPRLCMHPNILGLLGTTTSIWALGYTNRLSLVTEYADLGSLEQYLHNYHGALTIGVKIQIIQGITAGLKSLHACDVVHNDLKCGNVLLFSRHSRQEVVPKISDFGCSVPLATTQPVRMAAGTRLFAAPEAYSEGSVVHPSRDLYSFGVSMFQIFKGNMPFVETYTDDDLWEAKQNETLLNYVSSVFVSIPVAQTIVDLILKLLSANPSQRYSDWPRVLELLGAIAADLEVDIGLEDRIYDNSNPSRAPQSPGPVIINVKSISDGPLIKKATNYGLWNEVISAEIEKQLSGDLYMPLDDTINGAISELTIHATEVDKNWFIHILSPVKYSGSDSPSLDMFQHIYAQRSRGHDQDRLCKRHYAETLYRARYQDSANAAFNVAMCHAFGLGTVESWDDCIMWLEIAASKGNKSALVFLKSVFPDLMFIFRHGDRDQGELIDIYEELNQFGKCLRDDGNIYESDNIAEILKVADNLRFTREHCKIVNCFCMKEESADPVTTIASEINGLLNRIWDLLPSTPAHPLPLALIRLFSEWERNPEMAEVRGALLSHLCKCQHSSDDEDGPDIILDLGMILLDHGCPVNGSTNESLTAMSLALRAGNLRLAELLISRGAVPSKSWWDEVMCAAINYRPKRLQFILQIATKYEGVSMMGFFEALRLACVTTYPKRRLLYGQNCEDRCQRTIEILVSYALDHSLRFEARKILSYLIWSGSHDLFKLIFLRISDLQSTPLDDEWIGVLLHDSIIKLRREIFIFLLDHGADPNYPYPLKGQPLRPISNAVLNFGRHKFFFYHLIGLDVDLSWGEEECVLNVHLLILDEDGSDALGLILGKHPHFILSSVGKNPSYWSFINIAMLCSTPSTVSVILQASLALPRRLMEHISETLWKESIKSINDERSIIALLDKIKILHSWSHRLSLTSTTAQLGKALRAACGSGDIALVKGLLEEGADPNYTEDGNEILSPVFAAYWRLNQFQRNLEPGIAKLTPFEKVKFQVVLQCLGQHGLDRSRRYGHNGRTLEDHIHAICARVQFIGFEIEFITYDGLNEAWDWLTDYLNSKDTDVKRYDKDIQGQAVKSFKAFLENILKSSYLEYDIDPNAYEITKKYLIIIKEMESKGESITAKELLNRKYSLRSMWNKYSVKL